MLRRKGADFGRAREMDLEMVVFDFFVLFELQFHYGAQVGLKQVSLLPQPVKC